MVFARRSVNTCLNVLFFPRPVFRDKQTGHRQNGAECYQQSDFFLQDNRRSNDGDNGNHININAGYKTYNYHWYIR